ncbi:hypothetical protein UCDDS831_g05038 [Diplodia seriata]|uniref:Uncharacterized protein n=1 Tax=Diplodia seriata TaxID=420778 RepID=A0A0G2G8N2_9PEZI|nr:hypothetical protein UCDDS831_g05038 [Diplodia seriata]
MAFEFLAPILTPTALATVQRDPSLLGILLAVLFGLNLLVGLAVFIHYRTEKDNGTWKGWGIPFWPKKKAKKAGFRKIGGK